MSDQLVYLNQIIIFAIFAMSLNLVQGYTGLVNIAQAAFGAIGGYGAALLSVHLGAPFLVGAVVGIALGFVTGVLLSIPALGVGANYVILLTLAFSYIVGDVLNSLNFFGGSTGILVKSISLGGLKVTSQLSIFGLFLVIGLLVFGFCWRIGESGYGRVLKGLREDEAATRSLGKNTVVFQAVIFGICASLAGLAGAMFAYYFGSVSPSDFTVNEAFLFVIMVVIGGSGNLAGSVVGAALITYSTPVLEDWVNVSPASATYWQQLVYGIALIIVIVFRPTGLLPERVAGRPRLWTRLRLSHLAAQGGRSGYRTGGAERVPVLAGADGANAAVAAGLSAGTESGLVPAARSGLAAASGGRDARVTDDGVPGDLNSGTPTLSDHLLEDEMAPTPSGPILAVRDLAKTFGGIRAVRGVNIDIPAGGVTALIGPNGAGKSTLFGLFTGFMRADAGSIKLKGVDICGKTPNIIAGMGMVRSFQDVRLFRHMTSLQNVMLAVPGQDCERFWRLFATPKAVSQTERATRERAMELLERVGMAGRANDLAADLGHGEQKLVAIARVLATNAELLLLDEPTSGVDPKWVVQVAQVIDNLPTFGRTVCVVEHNLGFLGMLHADCYFMEAGRILTHGTLDELMADEQLRRVYFGV